MCGKPVMRTGKLPAGQEAQERLNGVLDLFCSYFLLKGGMLFFKAKILAVYHRDEEARAQMEVAMVSRSDIS